MNLILMGYMASGKSFVGRTLADFLKYDFIDLDDFIESEENLSIKDIFEQKGELYFRKAEKANLEKLIAQRDKTIISLGGGTPCYYDTIDTLINDETLKTIYLNVSIPEIVKRLNNETSKRPLVANIKTEALLTEYIGKHLFERAPYYNKAEYVINANRPVKEIVEDIVLQLF